MKDYSKNYRINNQKKIITLRKRYQESGKNAESQRKYQETHKQEITNYWKSPKGKMIFKLNNLKRKGILHDFMIEEWIKKIDKTNGICPKCHKYVGEDNLTLDHIIPISAVKKGFVYHIEDVQPLCIVCNIRKSDKLLA